MKKYYYYGNWRVNPSKSFKEELMLKTKKVKKETKEDKD